MKYILMIIFAILLALITKTGIEQENNVHICGGMTGYERVVCEEENK